MRQKANNLPANSQSHSRRRCRCRRWRRRRCRRLCRKWPVVVSLQCCNCCKRTWKFVIRLCGWKEKKTGYKSLQLHTNTIAHRLKRQNDRVHYVTVGGVIETERERGEGGRFHLIDLWMETKSHQLAIKSNQMRRKPLAELRIRLSVYRE